MRDDEDVAARSPADRLVLLLGVALLLVVTAVQVLPAPGRLGTHVLPNDGDPVLVTWILEHQARALLDDPGSLYRANIFFPEPAAIAWSDNLTAFVPPYLLLWLATGRDSVLAYNLLTFLAFAGSALAVLALARRLLASPVAAVVVAVAFSVAMVRRSAVGHTQLGGFFFLPVLLLLLMDVTDRRRLRSAVLAGACLAGLWYTAIYYFVLAVAVVPVLALVWAATHRHEVDRRLVGLVACTAAVGAALVAPSLPPYLELQQLPSFERGDDELLTIGPGSFPRPPSVLHRASDRESSAAEGSDGFLGWTVLALAGSALVGGAGSWLVRRRRGTAAQRPTGSTAPPPGRGDRRDPQGARRRFGLPLAAACTLAGLLALGPDDGALSVPYRAMRQVVPGLESVRALNRFWVLPALGVAVLAGRGLERLTARARPWPTAAVGTVVVGLVLLEMLVRPGSSEVDDGPALVAVNHALGEVLPGVVTELPVPPLSELPFVFSARQLRSLEDGLPRVEGYSGDAPPGMGEYLDAVSTFPSGVAVDALRGAGVRHVVLHGGPVACAGRFGPEELRAVVDASRRSPAVDAVVEAGGGAIVTLAPEGTSRPDDAVQPALPPRTTASCEQN